MLLFSGVRSRFTRFLLIANIPANQVTLPSLLSGLAGGALLTFANPFYWIGAALFLYLFLILDLVDGEIARYKRAASPRGAFWDGISGLFTFGNSAVILLSLYQVSHFFPYYVLHEKGLLLKAIEINRKEVSRGF